MSGTKAPSARRRRGIAIVAGAAVAAVVGAMAAVVVLREELAHAVLHDRLAGLGVENPRFRVSRITADSLIISDFASDGSLSFERLTVGFTLGDILRGQAERIDLVGLRLDLTQPGPWDRLKDSGNDRSGPYFDARLLPSIAIRQAQLRLAAPTGLMTVAGDASLRPGSDGGLQVQGYGLVAGPAGDVDVAVDGSVRAGAQGDVVAEGRLRAASAEFAAGSAAFKSLKVDLPMTVAATAAGITVQVQQGARFESGQLDLGAGVGAGPISGAMTGRLSLAPSPGRWLDGMAEIAIDAQDLRATDQAARQVTALLPLRIEVGPGTAAIIFSRDGSLALDGVRPSGEAPAIRVSGTISGRIGLSWAADGGGGDGGLSVDHELRIAPAPITIPGPTALSASLGTIRTSGSLAADRAYRGQVLIDTGNFARGGRSIAAKGIAIGLTTGAGMSAPVARVTVDALRAASPSLNSLSFSVAATLRQAGQDIVYQAEIGGFGIAKLAAVSGLQNLGRRAGEADVSIPEFALGNLPAPLLKALSTVRNVKGRVGGDAYLAWKDEQVTGRALLRLGGVGGETGDGAFEGLGGTIELDRLFPLSTAPDQRLHIKKIRVGADVTDVLIRFELLPSGILRIGRLDATVAGGGIVVAAPTVDLLGQQARATVTLVGVRLERLLSLLDLGDFHATGQIHGVVPIQIAGSSIAIDGSALKALGGGTLRFKSERAKQVLKTGGSQVELMLQALEDFTYEQLGVDIDKSLTGDAKVTLRTLGHNPAVLAGRKFQININLETNLDRLLDATMQWYRLSGKALRNIVGAGSRERNK